MDPSNQAAPQTLADHKTWHLGVLTNPNSGGNRKGLAAISDILRRQPDALHREVVTLPETAAALDEFVRSEVNLVAINGGDATIQTVLTALFHLKPYEQLPLLAILRAGTDSAIARDIGIQGSRDRGLRKLVNWIRHPDGKGTIFERPVMRVQSSVLPQSLYGMIFGAAAIYQGILFCRRNIYSLGVRGVLAPSLTAARFLLGIIRKNPQYATTATSTIELDQIAPIRGDFLMVLVSTIERVLFGLRPYWGTEAGPLRFTAISNRPHHLMRVLPSMALEQKCRLRTPQNGYFSHNASEARLTLSSGFMLDGELHPIGPDPEEVVINCGGLAPFLRL